MTQFPPTSPALAPGGPDTLPRPVFQHRRTPVWLWVLTLVLLGTVAVLQSLDASESPTPTPEEHAAAIGKTTPPPEAGGLVLFAKIGLLLRDLTSQSGSPPMGDYSSQLLDTMDGIVGEQPWEDPGKSTPPPPPNPEERAPAAAERLRGAIVAAELGGPEEAIKRLDRLEHDLAEDSDLRKDIAALRTIYTAQGDLTDQMKDDLAQRHGWYGRLASSYRSGDADPTRKAALADARKLMVFYVAVGAVFLVAFLAGLVMVVVALIMAASGKLRSGFVRGPATRAAPESVDSTAVGASATVGARIWLETFSLFVGSFLTLKLVSLLVDMVAPNAPWHGWMTVAGQWLLLLTLFWPVARGMSWPQFRGEIGWHRGRGIFREIGAGIVAYVTALPVYLGVALVCVLLMFLLEALVDMMTGRTGQRAAPVPPTKITDMISHGSLWFQIAIATLVVVWAPLVEESVFRGALYRHFRSRMVVPLAALLTGGMFAAMHSYMPIQLILVGTLGIIFCLMREWRGSLIPSMTAHCIHNSGVLLLLTVTMRFMQP